MVQQRAFQEDGVIKLSGVVDESLLDEINSCFDWAGARENEPDRTSHTW
jgi:hypothetical protein